MPARQYNKQSTNEVQIFVSALKENAQSGGTFDSAGANNFINGALSQNDVVVPDSLQAVLSSVSDKEVDGILRAVLDGASSYQRAHGQEMPADVLEQALHSAYSTTPEGQKAALDSIGTSLQSAMPSYQSNRAIVAILTTTTEAIPFVHYLPADIKSNQAKLAILTHTAGSAGGFYAEGSILDGAHSGERYISAARDHVLTHGASGALTGKITATQKTADSCDPAGTVAKLVRGSAIVYVNGLRVASEYASNLKSSPISGSVVIAGVTHAISGTIDTDNGNIALVATPELPSTAEVLVEAFIDYERQTDLTPSIITGVETFDMYANSWRATTTQSMDSRTQMNNELGLDSYSEGVIAIQAQFANERHYDVLRKARRVGACNKDTFNFNWVAAGDYKVRADIWRDFSAVLGAASQRMALLTMNHGITHLYVGEKIASQMLGLPTDMWQPSGITTRAGIYRLGRLFGKYDVYYTPRVVKDEAESAEILCIGQASDVTRNAFILGDAVAPTVIPLATNSDLKTGAGYYARNFTSVNPHAPSAQGAALITVTNLF